MRCKITAKQLWNSTPQLELIITANIVAVQNWKVLTVQLLCNHKPEKSNISVWFVQCAQTTMLFVFYAELANKLMN